MNNPQMSSSAGPKRKGFISEGDVALLLRRYSASTILALLQEVANSAETKLNWSCLVKNTNTGIKNAKEYQALWRHLAYRTNIAESFEDDAEPLDDDSDLEFEVEPLPGVSPEVAADVAACVKVLAATGAPGNTPMQNSETCFTIDIPNSSSGWEVKGNGQISNVVVPGAPSSEAQPARKKRKRWTLEEDQELVAAVEKCGEGNWAVILKGAFKHDRTAAQLSQRWALIRKRRENQAGSSHNMVAEGQTQATGNATGGTATVPLLTPAEGQKTSIPALGTTASAAAMNISLIPATGSSTAPFEQNSSPARNISNTSALPPLAGKARPPAKKVGNAALQVRPAGILTSSVAAQAASTIGGQPKANPGSTVPVGPVVNQVPGRYNVSSGLRNSPISFSARGNPKVSTGPDPMVQAAAVAAGARIAPASAAASLLKAAQSGNIVHIGPSGVSMAKPGMQNQMGSSTGSSGLKVAAGAGTRNPSGTLVHYIRTGTGSPQSVVLNGQRASQMKSQPTRTGSAPPEAITTQPASVVGLSGSAACGPPGPSLPVQKPLPSSPTMLLATRPKVKGSHIPGDSSANAVLNSPVKPTDSGEGSIVNNHTAESHRHIVGPSSQRQLPVSSLENSKPAAVVETVIPLSAVEKATASPVAMSCPMQSEEGKSISEITKRRLSEELKPVGASSHGCLLEKENLSSTSKDLHNLSAAKSENS